MNLIKFFNLILTVTFFASTVFAAAAAKQKTVLGAEATAALTEIYNQVERLHDLMYESNESAVNAELTAFKTSLEKGIEGTKKEQISSQHINRVLLATLNHINTAQNTQGEQRNKNLKDAFKQLVILYQTYKTNNDLKIYWCHTDRAVWLQKVVKTQNPFEPKVNCGQVAK